MRPQQQNRRMRGRINNNNNNNNNNNRKGPNPLTRNYESNGPDVKIRGSAQQIAEKYTTLARDAQSSGDRVMAENYLQHAEHYNRIIAAAQAQMPIQNPQQNRDDFDEDGDDERDDLDNGNNTSVTDAPLQMANHGSGPQPVIDGTPAEVALNSEGGRNGSGNGGNRHRDRDRRPNGGYGQNGQRGDYAPRGEQGEHRGEQANARDENRRDDVQAESPAVVEQPAPQFENLSPAGLAAQAERNEAAGGNETAGEKDAAPRRARRPRRPRVEASQAEGGDSADAAPTEAVSGEPAITES